MGKHENSYDISRRLAFNSMQAKPMPSGSKFN